MSFGLTGNDQIGNYQYLSTYNVNSNTYQGATTLVPTQIPNPNFSWEKVKKTEVGLELGFIKERIKLSTAYFYNLSNNELVGYSLPAVSGFTAVLGNLPASLENSGWELTLNTQNITSKVFSWTSSFNITLPQK